MSQTRKRRIPIGLAIHVLAAHHSVPLSGMGGAGFRVRRHFVPAIPVEIRPELMAFQRQQRAIQKGNR